MRETNAKIKKLSEENENNKIESEKLTKEIEELKYINEKERDKLSKEIEELKHINDTVQELQEHNEKERETLTKKIEELKYINEKERDKLLKEIEELKQINENTIGELQKAKKVEDFKQIKEENQTMKITIEEIKQEMLEFKKKYEKLKEDKHNITNQPPIPLFQSKEELLTGGFEKFIENNNRLTFSYSSYEEWYRDIFKKMGEDTLYLYEKYMFTKVWVNKHGLSRNNTSFHWQSNKRSDNEKLKLEMVWYGIKTYAYNENWNNEHIKYCFILHPKEINEILELDCKFIGDDYDEYYTDISVDFYHEDYFILCCKKK